LKKSEAVPSDFYTNLYNLYNEGIFVKTERLVYPVDLTGNLKDLNEITEKLRVSKAEAIREAIKHYAEHLRGLEVVTYRDLPKGQAKREIRRYLKGKTRVRADEISDALRIDFELVNEVLLELWEEGWVEPER
jgi:hypothetical protein